MWVYVQCSYVVKLIEWVRLCVRLCHLVFWWKHDLMVFPNIEGKEAFEPKPGYNQIFLRNIVLNVISSIPNIFLYVFTRSFNKSMAWLIYVGPSSKSRSKHEILVFPLFAKYQKKHLSGKFDEGVGFPKMIWISNWATINVSGHGLIERDLVRGTNVRTFCRNKFSRNSVN